MKDKIVITKRGTRYFLANKEVTEEEYRIVYPLPPNDTLTAPDKLNSGYPFKCNALGYHPKQRQEALAHLEKLGVPTEITKAGDPVIRDAAHYKKLRRALGVHFRNAYDD